jgi:hypothetical protein
VRKEASLTAEQQGEKPRIFKETIGFALLASCPEKESAGTRMLQLWHPSPGLAGNHARPDAYGRWSVMPTGASGRCVRAGIGRNFVLLGRIIARNDGARRLGGAEVDRFMRYAGRNK